STHRPPLCAGESPHALYVSASMVRLGQDRLRGGRASGAMRESERHPRPYTTVCPYEFIPLSFWYDAPLISRDSDRRHHPWPVYGSLTCSPARWSSWISLACPSRSFSSWSHPFRPHSTPIWRPGAWMRSRALRADLPCPGTPPC